MAVQLECQLQLGADTIGARYQHRFLEFLADFEQRTESTEAADHAFAHRPLGKRLDCFDQRIAGIDINPGVAIRKGNFRSGTHHVLGAEAVKYAVRAELKGSAKPAF